MKKIHFTVILAAIACVFASCSQGYTVFSNGRSEYSIVVASDASESEQYAAKELQHWVEEVSGTTLPIGDEQSGKAGKRLIVGHNNLCKELLAASGVEIPETEGSPMKQDESFSYCHVGGDILLFGGDKRGTLYAVYSLLENELDCRWYTSTVSVAPKRKKWSFQTLMNHEEPGIEMRDNFYWDVINDAAFATRTRNNTVLFPPSKRENIPGTSQSYYWGAHTMGHFIPASEYFDKHPEYFSLIDGKRQRENTQLCLSNPEVLQICIEKMRQTMREQPNHVIYALEQNDCFNPCQCPQCQALVDQYGGQSGILVWFVNQVADAIHEEFPDKFVGTFAYQYTRRPPKDIRPKDNVVIRLCSIECCLLHDYDECDENKNFQKDLEEWSAIAPHLYIWDYVVTFTHYMLPLPNFQNLQSHIQAFRDHHAIGILEEGAYQSRGAELDEMRAWVLSKLLWNPECNVDSLIEDFTNGFYGAAAPYIREYLAYEHTILRREGVHVNCFPQPTSDLYTDEYVTESRQIFQKAKEAVAEDSTLLARVELAELPLCYLELERTPEAGKEDGALDLFKRVTEREGIERMAEWGGATSAKDFIKAIESK